MRHRRTCASISPLQGSWRHYGPPFQGLRSPLARCTPGFHEGAFVKALRRIPIFPFCALQGTEFPCLEDRSRYRSSIRRNGGGLCWRATRQGLAGAAGREALHFTAALLLFVRRPMPPKRYEKACVSTILQVGPVLLSSTLQTLSPIAPARVPPKGLPSQAGLLKRSEPKL